MRGEPRLRSVLPGLAALFAGLCHMGSVLAADCQGRIGPETRMTGRTQYDPFAPVDVTDAYRLTVTNTGAQPCRYGLLFRSRSPSPMLGGTLAYALSGEDGRALLGNAPALTAPLARTPAPVEPNAAAAVTYALTIPRGQFAAPGDYADDIALELYALDDSGRAKNPALHTATLAISYTVPRVLSVNVKGGEMTTTLAFGELASGQQRAVVIEARSNQTYRLEVASEKRGALTLTPKVPGEDWSVPYTATLAGQRLDLVRGTALGNLPATAPGSEASYALTVTIGDAARKRAGRYEDVITIEVNGVGR